jgi:putative serine protease PepD
VFGKLWRSRGALAGAGFAAGALIAVLVITLVPNGNVASITVNDGDLPHGSAVDVAKALGPTVGTVIATEPGGENAIGSGFVIAHTRSLSYLLTNQHVVSGAQSVHVAMPNGQTDTATVVGSDAFDDLAVISVPDPKLPVAQFGKSSTLRVGQTVIAIGSPLGNTGSVTQGVISALHRTIKAGSSSGNSSETLQDVLQTDAAIDPGNSGGPLADAAGRVIGVNVAYAGSNNRIGYSIPSDLADVVAQRLIKGQKVQHPFLGISYLTGTDAVQSGRGFDGPGVLVTQVQAKSPAESAGIKVDDIIVAVDGTDIDNGQTLGGLISTKKVGQTVSFRINRKGSASTVQATLIERPGE